MTEMSVGDWGSIASAVIAALALGFSIWSYRSSREAGVFAKQSADAAEKSALEAEKARKISQFEVLSPHFSNVEHLIKAFNGWEGTNGIKIAASGASVQHLIDALHKDDEFQKGLISLRKTLGIQPLKDVVRNYST